MIGTGIIRRNTEVRNNGRTFEWQSILHILVQNLHWKIKCCDKS